MTRALTQTELNLIRSDNQTARLYLAIPQPPVVFQAQINQTFDSLDMVLEISYDNVTKGNYADIKPDMTLLIGTSPGAYDVGVTRIRAAATSSKLFIAETSEIKFADDQYLTVLASWEPWPRHIRIGADKRPRIDSTIIYSDQHKNCDPVPVLGPHRVAKLVNGLATLNFDASNSWVIASSITQYAWEAPGAYSSSGMNTATPTINYNAAGTYYVSCAVTAANGKSFTGYRVVYVYDDDHPPITQFRLEKCVGRYSQGGWEAEVTLYDEASLTQIRDRSLAMLFADDYYAGQKTSIGPISGSEHIVFIGWIATEDLVYSPSTKTLTFTIEGLHKWLDKMPGFPAGIEDTDFANNGGGDPDRWTEFKDLTVDKGAWHFLHWRTTVTRCADVVSLTGDTKQTSTVEANVGSIWDQLSAMYESQLLARVLTDRYSRLFAQVDPQLRPVSARSSIPVVMNIQKNDWIDPIDIKRNVISEVGLIDLSGIAYSEGKATPYFSRAPGNVFKRFGSVETLERLLLSSQEQANELAGLVLGYRNNEYPSVVIRLASNQRMSDIVPAQYVTLTINAQDTVRGIVWNQRKLIPREISYSYDEDAGCLLTTLVCEAETFPENAVTVLRPQTPWVNPAPPLTPPPFEPTWPIFPPLPPWPTPEPPYIPPPNPEPPTEPSCMTDLNYPPNGPYFMFSGSYTLENENVWSIRLPVYGVFRSPNAVHRTRFVMTGRFLKRNTSGGQIGAWTDTMEDGFYTIRAVDYYGNTVAYGVRDPVTGDGTMRTGVFDNTQAVAIQYIIIELASSGSAPVDDVWYSFNSNHPWYPPEDTELTWSMVGPQLHIYAKGKNVVPGVPWIGTGLAVFIRPRSQNQDWLVGWHYCLLKYANYYVNNQFYDLLMNEPWVQQLYYTNDPSKQHNFDGVVVGPFSLGWPMERVIQVRARGTVNQGATKIQTSWYRLAIWKASTYRIDLASFQLYNICTIN